MVFLMASTDLPQRVSVDSDYPIAMLTFKTPNKIRWSSMEILVETERRQCSKDTNATLTTRVGKLLRVDGGDLINPKIIHNKEPINPKNCISLCQYQLLLIPRVPIQSNYAFKYTYSKNINKSKLKRTQSTFVIMDNQNRVNLAQ